MILQGTIAKLFIRLLLRSSLFKRHFKVVQFADAFKIYRSRSAATIKKIVITPANILRLRFDLYESRDLLKEYTAQIDRLDETGKLLTLNVWDSEQMTTFIKQFSISLTDQTFTELKALFEKQVFDEKYGAHYKHFIWLYLHPAIKKAPAPSRQHAEGTFKYSLLSADSGKERRLKSKFSVTKQEALIFSANISYWLEK